MSQGNTAVVVLGLSGAGLLAYTGSLIVAGAIVASIAAYLLSKPASAPVALNPSQKIACTLIEKEELTHDVRRFRFALLDPKSQLGLPIGRHVMLSAKVS